MGIVNNVLAGASGNQGYFLSRSLRFRSSASAYISRTPSTSTNRRTWTWSGWVKRGALGSVTRLFSADNGAQQTLLRFQADNTLQFQIYNSAIAAQIITTQVFRDPSAWYHIVAVMNTTDATSSNRMQLYVNGSQITALGTATYPTQNYDAFVNQNILHSTSSAGSSEYWDGYLAEVNFIDGQALTPSSFGMNDPATGVWEPKKYTGTYGTNGFYLPFTDNSNNTATTIGKDFSGNGNNWTPNNISVTAGVTYDSMTDVPTLTSATTANYATLNPLIYSPSTTYSRANLSFSANNSNWTQAVGSIVLPSSGKWYWEVTIGSPYTSQMHGITAISSILYSAGATNWVGWNPFGYAYWGDNGNKFNNNANSAYGATYTANDIIGVAFDADIGTLVFYKNNVSQGTAFTGLTAGPYYPAFSLSTNGGATSADVNFGQRPFAYTPPSGFVALNTFNLPTPTIGATPSSQANQYMDVTLYTGNGSARSITNSGSMPPDLVWLKRRNSVSNHYLQDRLRGALNSLFSDSTSNELTQAGTLTSFNSNGFSLGTDAGINQNNDTYVAWQWRANGTGVTNTAGSITSTVSANTTAGFSIVTYTGTGANATVGHGLGVAPSIVIIKRRNSTSDWSVYYNIDGLGAGVRYLLLNSTAAGTFDTTYWNSTVATSTVFSLGTNANPNTNTGTYVAYCFAQVAGYSRFGSYTGNGSADGAFVFTGFRPRFIMVKRTDSTGSWWMWDTSRTPINVANSALNAGSSGAENTNNADLAVDILSNGFKWRTAYVDENANGGTYIYMAFAESPFKYSIAR